MEKDHPILLISTSKQCGACKGVKGNGEGWPVEDDDYKATTLPFQAKKPYKWNVQFFEHLLTAGNNDGVQRMEIFEVMYDSMSGAADFANEFAIYSLDKGKLVVKRFKAGPNDGMVYATYVAGGPEPVWKVDSRRNFYKYRDSWLPIHDISRFIYFFPGFAYSSSVIWRANIQNREEYALYMVAPGLTTIEESNDHTKYRFHPKNVDKQDMMKDPVNVINSLIKDPSRYHYPSNHEQFHK